MNANKTILITGCSSGIGLCAAQMLHKNGWQVFAGVRKLDDKIRLQAQGLKVVLIDLNNSPSIIAGVKEVLTQTNGRLDALLNNAGFGQPGAIEDLSRDALRAQFETNVFGLQELTNLIVPIMRAQGYGRIINMSSVLGLITMAYRGAYCASKYAVEALSDALRLELHGTKITVSLIEPGPIESSFRNAARAVYEQHVVVDKSAHKVRYTNLMHNMEQLKSESTFTLPPEAVVKKILHALQSPRPKIRYYVTVPAYILATLKRILPSRSFDWIMWRIYKSEIKSNP